MHSCCPHYTLRLDSNQFKSSKDQRQAVNRFNKFLSGEAYIAQSARLNPKTREESKKRDNEFDLVERIHEAEYEYLSTPPDPAHQFTVTLEDDTFTDEKYHVYENYQIMVHKESPDYISPSGFKNFLCNSPVRRETVVGADGKERRLGSYHQCYRLDGKLVAIGVLDLLPDCVSAVYFLYHESIHKFSPGKLGALREIALAREKGYRWWYPGFYIHSCPKMRYKMDYSPQYILDPEALTWGLLDNDVLKLLDDNSHPAVARERLGKDDSSGDKDIDADPAVSPDSDDDSKGLKSLFHSDMPGIVSIEELMTLDLDHIPICLDGTSNLFETADLVVWGSQAITESESLKGRVAELVAAISPDLLSMICLDFNRSRR
jgi:arginyl-tRNA---protein transferase